jgi:hypothetical protein
MGTQLTVINAPLPAHLQKHSERAKAEAASAKGGIKSGGFTRISISGGKFHLHKDKKSRLITDPRDPSLPLMKLEVVAIRSNPNLSKQFYEGDYSPGDNKEPDCSSEDGITPDVAQPKSPTCANCYFNKWGSKITPEGKPAKACSDNKRLVILPLADLNYEPLGFNVTPGSLKAWGEYVEALDKSGRGVFGVVTAITFDPHVSFPKVNFNYVRDLTEAETDLVLKRADSPEAENIVNPKAGFQTAPAQPAVPTEPVKPLAQNHVPATEAVTLGGAGFAPPVAPTPTAPTAPAPIAPAFAPPVAPAPTAPATPVDPYAGHPAYVKVAVEAAGGLGTPSGAQVFAQLTAGTGGAQVPAKGPGRPRKAAAAPAAPAAAPAAPVAPQAPAGAFGLAPEAPAPTAPTAAAPATPAGGFSAAPAAAVAPAGQMSDLGALLDAALKA